MVQPNLEILASLRGRLIVSCQALPAEPLHGPQIMARMALAAAQGGAAAIRANGPEDIRAIRALVSLPLIGLFKHGEEGVYITPTLAHAQAVAQAGADIIAIDATQRPRPGGERLEELIAAIRDSLGRPVLADVSTYEEGLAAEAQGAAAVSTTLAGYTPYSRSSDGPDLELVGALARSLAIPVIAEGRIRTPEEARAALEAGAFAVVVGAAITRPQWITAQFSVGIEQRRP